MKKPLPEKKLEITWSGAASTKIHYQNGVDFVIYFDPYVSRNPHSSPQLDAKFEKAFFSTPAGAETLALISHNHFDHRRGIPSFKRTHPESNIYVPFQNYGHVVLEYQLNGNARTIRAGETLKPFRNLTVTAFSSDHVTPNAQLIFRTILRGLSKEGRKTYDHLPNISSPFDLLRELNPGQTLSYLINLDGIRIQHIGSAGTTEEQLEAMAGYNHRNGRVNILLLAAQGHEDIQNKDFVIANTIKPDILIPIHHNNSDPFITEKVSVSELQARIERELPQTRFLEMKVGETVRDFRFGLS